LVVRLGAWLRWVRGESLHLDPYRRSQGWHSRLREFPEACREALERDPGALEGWGEWLGSAECEAFLHGAGVADDLVKGWQQAWMAVWVEAARTLLARASWTDRTFPRSLPGELRHAWRERGLPDFPWEGFWEDLVRLLLGTRARVGRAAWSVFPVVFRGNTALPLRYEVEGLEGWNRGGVFPDPAEVLVRPMRADFLGALREAEQAARPGGSVRVRVVPVNPRDEIYLCTYGLEGSSGAGALYVALRALEAGLQPSPGLAITFGIEGGQPRPVGGLELKVRGCADYGLGELLTPEECFPAPDVSVRVIRISTLEEAESEALGVGRAVRAYLEALKDRLDRTPWHDLQGNLIAVTRIAVPMRVLKKVVRRKARLRGESPAGEPEPGRERSTRRPRYVDPEVARYYEEPVEYEETRESVRWEQEMAHVRRAVILGAPGGGKTFLTRWTALRLADESLQRVGSTRLEDLPLPLHVELPRLAAALQSREGLDALRECVAEAFPLRAGSAFRKVLDLLPESPGWWLILDAWDQVSDRDWGVLREWLRSVEGWKCRVVVTCRTARYDRQALPWNRASEYELEPLEPEGVQQLFERWFADGRGGQLWRSVQDAPALLGACRSPLVASLVCLVHQEQGLAGSLDRGGTYDRALRLLIRSGWERLGKTGHGTDVDRRLEVLTEAAWELFGAQPEANDFARSQMEGALRRVLKRLVYRRLGVDELLHEWVEAGILQDVGWQRGEIRLAFLHRSFLEYLAGRALARRLEEDWERWEGVVDRKAWHLAWQETLVFTGQALDEQGLKRLVGVLTERDDYFRHRLALALRVLAEHPIGGKCAIEIVDAAWKFWWGLENELLEHLDCWTHAEPFLARLAIGTIASIRDLRVGRNRRVQHATAIALRQLGQVRARPETLPVVLAYLRDEDRIVRAVVAEALGLMEQTGRQPEVIQGLIERLRDEDEDEDVRRAAARALGLAGKVAARPEVIQALVEGLRDEKGYMRKVAAEALGQIGAAAARPEVIQALVEGLRDEKVYMRKAAAEALGQMGAAAARPEVIQALVERLSDEEVGLRWAAARALGQMGAAAARPEVIQALVVRLWDENEDVCEAALEALRLMGAAGALPEFIKALVERLQDEDDDERVREAAAETLRLMRTAARPGLIQALVADAWDEDTLAPWFGGTASPEAIQDLVERLQDENEDVREAAREALRLMRTARPEVIQALAEHLWDENGYVRRAAARALGLAGKVAARPEVIQALMDDEAFETLWRTRAGVVRPEFIQALEECLQDQDEDVRKAAPAALGLMRIVAARPGLIEALKEHLQDEDENVREAAAAALGLMGVAATSPGLIQALVDCLWHRDFDEDLSVEWVADRNGEWDEDCNGEWNEDWDKWDEDWNLERLQYDVADVRAAAAEALGAMGEAAATPKVLQALTECLRDKDEGVRYAAAGALGRMGKAAAQPEVIRTLVKRLQRDPSLAVRRNAARTLGAWHRQGLRFFRDLGGSWTIRTVEELSGGAELRDAGPRPGRAPARRRRLPPV
jgi:HEAT repeat protein